MVASAEAKPCETGKARKHLISCGNSHPQHRAEGFQRAIGKPFGRLRRGETLRNGKSKEASYFLWKFPSAARGPKVSKGRPESPLVASAEAKPSVKRKKQGSIFSLPSISNLLLVGGFVRLRADEVLSPRGKVPKGRRRLRIRQRRIRRSQSDLAFAKRKPTLGGQRVQAAWPPPVPPLLSNSAPLASQGRARLVLLRTWEGRCRLRRSRSLPRCVGAG